MAGDHPSKHELKDAKVYIHEKDESSGSQNIHIDVEHPELNKIIEPDETAFAVSVRKENLRFSSGREHVCRR